MSLQGTLETFAVPDVLSLLAATKKTGELRVDGDRSRGRLWLDAGRVVAADVARAATLADAVFELLRLSGGTFSFDGDGRAAEPAAPVAVDELLAEAQARLGQWRAIEAVVPSLACPVRLVPALGGEEVTVSAGQWKALVAVATGGDVHGVVRHLEVGEFEACRAVKDLVDAGLVAVKPAPAAPAPTSAPDPQGAAAPAAPAAAPGAAAVAAPARPPARSNPAPAPVAPRVPASRRTATTTAPPAGPPPAPPAGSPTRRPGPAPSLQEAEELVHQLASLRSAPPRPGAADPAPAPGADAPAPAPARETEQGTRRHAGRGTDKATEPADEAPAEDAAGSGGAAPAAGGRSEEEPINRGMLLKFLSSVRS